MARFATIAAGMALMIAQPITVAWAQSTESESTTAPSGSERRPDGTFSFFQGRPDRIVLALGALTAVILGIATISKGHHNNNGPRPTSP